MLAGRREGPTSLRWVAGAEAGKGAPGVRRARARARGAATARGAAPSSWHGRGWQEASWHRQAGAGGCERRLNVSHALGAASVSTKP